MEAVRQNRPYGVFRKNAICDVQSRAVEHADYAAVGKFTVLKLHPVDVYRHACALHSDKTRGRQSNSCTRGRKTCAVAVDGDGFCDDKLLGQLDDGGIGKDDVDRVSAAAGVYLLDAPTQRTSACAGVALAGIVYGVAGITAAARTGTAVIGSMVSAIAIMSSTLNILEFILFLSIRIFFSP